MKIEDSKIAFMAHAPPPPSWFKPKMKTARPKVIHSQHSANLFFAENQMELDEWDLEHAREFILQWPLYWATEQFNRLRENLKNETAR